MRECDKQRRHLKHDNELEAFASSKLVTTDYLEICEWIDPPLRYTSTLRIPQFQEVCEEHERVKEEGGNAVGEKFSRN